MSYDLLIRHAKTRFSGEEPLDIGIKGGRIVSIKQGLEEAANQVIDAGGKLVTESFVNGHLHLCKVYTLDRIGDKALISYHGESMGKAMTAIELASQVKETYDHRWIIDNVRKALNLAVTRGRQSLDSSEGRIQRGCGHPSRGFPPRRYC